MNEAVTILTAICVIIAGVVSYKLLSEMLKLIEKRDSDAREVKAHLLEVRKDLLKIISILPDEETSSFEEEKLAVLEGLNKSLYADLEKWINEELQK